MFKDKMNRWITSGLFEETALNSKEFVLFTMEDAKNKFVECNDMTGYIFAKKHLGGWQHWKALLASPVLRDYIEEWMDELEVKVRSEAILRLQEDAAKGNYNSNKYLADRGWDLRKAGRPSKEEIEKNINKETKMRESISGFLTRVK